MTSQTGGGRKTGKRERRLLKKADVAEWQTR